MSTASPGPPGISNYKPSITSQEPSSDLQDAVKHPHSIVIPLFGQVIIDAPYSVQTKKWPKFQWKNIRTIFFFNPHPDSQNENLETGPATRLQNL